MSELLLTCPGRLHFGLLANGDEPGRRHGGIGLMIDRPGLTVAARPAPDWQAHGPLAGRVLRFAERVAAGLEASGSPPPRAAFRVIEAPAEHVGLGTGTQLGLAVARLLAELAGLGDLPAPELARLSGRGLRSGVGLHGFALGGLIVDGGHRREGDGPAPLVARLPWPDDWWVLVATPEAPAGLHGADESRAFAGLPPIPPAATGRLCRLVLLGLLPAAAERDLDAFGEALGELQQLVGERFAPAQGGVYASQAVAALADRLRSLGLRGVGQSSWGPTLYGLHRGPAEERAEVLDRLGREPRSPSARWTRGSERGAVLERPEPSPG